MDSYQKYGMTAFFGQEEKVAGTKAGERLKKDGANAASRDANPKITRPTTNIRVWPMRSPRVPLPSSRPTPW